MIWKCMGMEEKFHTFLTLAFWMKVSGHASARPYTSVHTTEATTNYGMDSVVTSTLESLHCTNRLSPVGHLGWGKSASMPLCQWQGTAECCVPVPVAAEDGPQGVYAFVQRWRLHCIITMALTMFYEFIWNLHMCQTSREHAIKTGGFSFEGLLC